MQYQYENRVISSFLVWLDDTICNKGQAWTNYQSLFYSMNSVFNGYSTYSAPFKQLIYNAGVTGATIMTGVYLNGTFVTTGQSGLFNIDYNEGRLYFSTGLAATTVISGNYALKDFNVSLTNQPDEFLLFETKYEIRPRITRTLSGLAGDTLTYPLIWIKDDGGHNEPFAFGGMDQTNTRIRTFILSDSQFKLDAVNSILKDKVRDYIPLLDDADMPLNNYGGLRQPFNYSGVSVGKVNQNKAVFIDRVDCSKFNVRSQDFTQLTQINPEIHVGIVDFEVSQPRWPRA